MPIRANHEVLKVVKLIFSPPDSGYRPSDGRRASRAAKGRAGFTLVEVMVAAAVLGLGIGSAFLCLQSGLKSLDTARTISVVTQVLQNEAERIRLLNWDAVQALPATATLDLPPQFEGTAAGGNRVTVIRRISDVSGHPDLKEVQLSARWEGITGTDHSRTLFLRYAKRGTYDYFYGKADGAS